jgi:trimethylamine--corrinoid protein Co-methyltransferase
LKFVVIQDRKGEPMIYSPTPKLKPIEPKYHLRILNDEQLDDFKSATLEILAEIGIHCPSPRAREIYAKHGAKVDPGSHIVKLQPDVVLEALSHAPRTYTMGARSEAHDLKLDGTAMYVATDGTGIKTVDFETGQHRPSVKDDLAQMARVADYLPSIGFYWPLVTATEYPNTSTLHELDASFSNTVKHVQTPTVLGARLGYYAVEMARVIAADSATLRQRPPMSLLVCTIAPLAQDEEGIEAALAFAEAGLPVGFMSMAATGLSAPATIPGTIAVGDAEIVSAMILVQMAYPGAPTYYSLMPGVMHPTTGDFMGSTWEADLFYAGGVELAHMWGVPTLAGVGTVAATSSWESACGTTSSMLLCALCGAETGSGLGLREGCTLLAPEALVLDSELYHLARMQSAGLDTSREALALDVIRAVGPRGHFLFQDHTRRKFRELQFSELAGQPAPGGGFRDPIEVAREKTDWILDNHYPEPLAVEQQAELKRILRAAEDELG